MLHPVLDWWKLLAGSDDGLVLLEKSLGRPYVLGCPLAALMNRCRVPPLCEAKE